MTSHPGQYEPRGPERPPTPGMRVGLCAGHDPTTRIFRVLGEARCSGSLVPPDQAAGSASTRFRRQGRHTAVFVLDGTRDVVYGTEARWLPLDEYTSELELWQRVGYTIVTTTPDRLRAALASEDDEYPFPE